MGDFSGLVAVVTGGASGIGAATVRLLSERGAHVAVLDRDIADVDDATYTAVTCDVTSTEAVDAAIARVVSRLGGIDVLVNNAGIGAVGDVTENDEGEWHRCSTSMSSGSCGSRGRRSRTSGSRHTR